VRVVYDLSATPFFLAGSNWPSVQSAMIAASFSSRSLVA
jgi:hypothetical protein